MSNNVIKVSYTIKVNICSYLCHTNIYGSKNDSDIVPKHGAILVVTKFTHIKVSIDTAYQESNAISKSSVAKCIVYSCSHIHFIRIADTFISTACSTFRLAAEASGNFLD